METDGSNDTGGRKVPPELVIVAVVALLAGLVLRFVARTPLWLDEAPILLDGEGGTLLLDGEGDAGEPAR